MSDFGMEPVDKIQAREEALQALGLDQSASSLEIRNAWREIAFHAHPDHTGGECKQFSRAKAAYDLLRKEGLTGKPQGPARPRRPKLKKRLIELADDAVAMCRGLLDPDRALPHHEDMAQPQPAARDCDHVPTAVGCHGRHLTFFVETPVREGANRVALPTSILSSCHKFEGEVLSFQVKSGGAGEVIVPDSIRSRKFPGARSVTIRFETDQTALDEFWQTS
ncbi:DnaJ domain protein [Ruegeria lacuscaerulensis ITI-1157]|nr:DnaJ domain protein [Ruegeria lacuscaerulensis ITI-1157]